MLSGQEGERTAKRVPDAQHGTKQSEIRLQTRRDSAELPEGAVWPWPALGEWT